MSDNTTNNRTKMQALVNILFQRIEDGTFRPSYAINADGEVNCRYLGPDDDRCAIGIHLPMEWLEEHHEEIEGKGVPGALSHIRKNYPEVDLSHMPVVVDGYDWLIDYQKVHDDAVTVSRRPDHPTFLELAESELMRFCNRHGFEVPDHGE